ncbi:MAG TPA: DinB family protein, partial [Segetibacter sp.]
AGKWSLKEMLLHITDTERIFSYRALRIARNDNTPLPGFDEKSFAVAGNADTRSWENLFEEFEAVRRSTDLLLASFTEEQLSLVGTTNNQPTSVGAICFVIYGHILHHINITKERYLH